MHEVVGSDGGGDVGAGAADVAASASGESGGTQPPLTHTQFEAGLIVVQVLGTGAGAGCDGADGGGADPAASASG